MLLKKRTGHEEEFNKRKLVRSLRRAGASRRMARQIVAEIKRSMVRTTAEVRARVILELRKIDSSLARRYESTRSLAVRESMETAKGTLGLHIETLNEMGAKRGGTVTVEHKRRKKSLVTEAGSVQMRWMQMNVSDIRDMRVREGMRLAVRPRGWRRALQGTLYAAPLGE
ncbi:MAG: ATP cone domain-containing protein [Thermoplasmata archaeon]